MSRNEHFADGAGLPQFKTRYHVSQVGMVPPPKAKGYGQLAPETLAALKPHQVHYDALPLTDVSLKQQPLYASQPTVDKRKVDRVPRQSPYKKSRVDPPKATPYKDGLQIFDGHHRTAHALVNGRDSIPMAVFDPANPRHVAHAAEVAKRIDAVDRPSLRDHVQKHGFFAGSTMKIGPEHDAARAAYQEKQAHALAQIERIKTHARTGWLA